MLLVLLNTTQISYLGHTIISTSFENEGCFQHLFYLRPAARCIQHSVLTLQQRRRGARHQGVLLRPVQCNIATRRRESSLSTSPTTITIWRKSIHGSSPPPNPRPTPQTQQTPQKGATPDEPTISTDARRLWKHAGTHLIACPDPARLCGREKCNP